MQTGNNAAITFGTSGWAAGIVGISISERTREAIADDILATDDFYTFEPDDLLMPETIDIEYELDTGDDEAPIAEPAETVTVTLPLKAGQTTAATLAGTGFATSHGGIELRNGQRITGKLTVKFDGKTGPVYTPGS